jgi:hypothetical protein
MVILAPLAGGGNIVALFGANTTSGSSWYDDMYVLFDTAVFPVVTPAVGTNYVFIMGDSTDIPVVGLTNTTLASNTAIGYGQPYRVQQTTEVGVHTHNALVTTNGVAAAANQRSEPNPQQATSPPNGQYSISGIGNVAEAYPQNPANFGVNYIIKALL